ncbi:hypothetical protein CYMTET_16328 [Cymbomonas tetramitiformis]|uniref:ARM repeat-containing protein n=1 Tax=Cymbomonas tetramitiformis TaxID=36881 RepID=A0AAE0GC86_9CHLO|nr:hypothetical protein CYMTET_16328 [Cymbomonas tetramitiformis]
MFDVHVDSIDPARDPLRSSYNGAQCKWLKAQLKVWDKGSRSSRLKMLGEFVARARHKTGPQLEMDYGNGASLFLARISAYLRLTYLLGHSTAALLDAISIFVSASSGNRFLTQFIEVGGVVTVLDVLTIPRLPVEDKKKALHLLCHVANAGRHYKEQICEHGGIDVVLGFLSSTTDDKAHSICQRLLSDLGRGNPRHGTIILEEVIPVLNCDVPGACRVSAQVIPPCSPLDPGPLMELHPQRVARALLAADAIGGSSDNSKKNGLKQPLVLGAVQMLRSRNFQVQYEASELLKVLETLPGVLPILIPRLVQCLSPPELALNRMEADDEDALLAMAFSGVTPEVTWKKTSMTVMGGILQNDVVPHAFVQQASAVKYLNGRIDHFMQICNVNEEPVVTTEQYLLGLLSCLANGQHVESRKCGLAALEEILASQAEVWAVGGNGSNVVGSMLLEEMGNAFKMYITGTPDRALDDIPAAILETLLAFLRRRVPEGSMQAAGAALKGSGVVMGRLESFLQQGQRDGRADEFDAPAAAQFSRPGSGNQSKELVEEEEEEEEDKYTKEELRMLEMLQMTNKDKKDMRNELELEDASKQRLLDDDPQVGDEVTRLSNGQVTRVGRKLAAKDFLDEVSSDDEG